MKVGEIYKLYDKLVLVTEIDFQYKDQVRVYFAPGKSVYAFKNELKEVGK